MLELAPLREVAQHLSSVFLAFGVPRPSAVILSLLYLVDRPLDYGEISSLSGYSKSSVSQAMKILEHYHLVSRVKSKRKSAYMPSLPLRSALAELQVRVVESAAQGLRERGKRSPELSTRVEKLEKELKELVEVIKAWRR
ncbi:MAG: hypothetical protein QXX83_09975 [Thermofilum sp.]